MTWINVDIAMPKDDQSVLAFDGKSVEIRSYNNEEQQWEYCDCCTHVWDITHWMPIPTGPE